MTAELDDEDENHPPTLSPVWEGWSYPVAFAVQRGISTTIGLERERIDFGLPGKRASGTRLRNCLAWLEMAGVIYHYRGNWKIAPYGVKWLERMREARNA
jgi:hypothetical protein